MNNKSDKVHLTIRHKHLNCKNVLRRIGIAEIGLGGVLCAMWLVTTLTAAVTSAMREGGGADAQTYYSDGMALASPGLVCGVFLFASGSIALSTRVSWGVSFYKANLALSAMAVVMMTVLTTISFYVAALATMDTPVRVLHVIMALLGLGGMVLCTLHCSYCCVDTCCRKGGRGRAGTHIDLQMVQPGKDGKFAEAEIKFRSANLADRSSGSSFDDDNGTMSQFGQASGTATRVTEIAHEI